MGLPPYGLAWTDFEEALLGDILSVADAEDLAGA